MPLETKVDVAKCHVPTRNEGGCRQAPRLPRKVGRRHRRPSAPQRAQARHQSQPSAISATPATQNEGGCDQVPCLPRRTKVDVAKCHACHAKLGGVTGDQARPQRPSAPPEAAQCHKCHACHAKPATQSWAASPATKRAQARHHSQPSAISAMPATQTKVDVTKCHACHAERRWTSPRATPATRKEGGCPQVPRRWMPPSATQLFKMVCDKVVCERWCVTKLCV